MRTQPFRKNVDGRDLMFLPQLVNGSVHYLVEIEDYPLVISKHRGEWKFTGEAPGEILDLLPAVSAAIEDHLSHFEEG